MTVAAVVRMAVGITLIREIRPDYEILFCYQDDIAYHCVR